MKIYLLTFFSVFLISSIFFANHKKIRRSVASSDKDTKSSSSIMRKNYKRSFITLNATMDYNGIALMEGRDGQYVKRLFGKLIQSADKLARDDFYLPKIDVYKNYYAFLLAAIQVPYHESKLTHFAKRDISFCYLTNRYLDAQILEGRSVVAQINKELKEIELQRSLGQGSSSLDKIYKVKKRWLKRAANGSMSIAEYMDKNFPQFYKAYGRGSDIFKDCKNSIASNEGIHQLLFSNDYADVGLMMFSAKSHAQVFASGDIFQVDKVIDYGLSYLYSGHRNSGGFKAIVGNSDNYDCLKGLELTHPKKYLLRLVRGVWAGQYNSGNISKTCRFMDSKNKWRANDLAFFDNFRKVYDTDYSKGSLWHRYLPSESIEEKAFFQIVNNLVHQRNNREYIDQVLKTDYEYQSEISFSNNPDEIEDMSSVQEDTINISDTDGNTTLIELTNEIINDVTTEEVEVQVLVSDEIDLINLEVQRIASQVIDDSLDAAIDEIEEIDELETSKEQGSLETDTLGDLPELDSDLYSHVIRGKRINIRSTASSGENNNLCGNTRLHKELGPIQVSKDPTIYNGFAKVSGEAIKKLLFKGKCENITDFFIHEDYVKKVKAYNGIAKVILPYQIVTRYGAGISAEVTNEVIGPGEVTITNEKVYSGKYIWLEFVDGDGVAKWFYAGEEARGVEYIK